MKAAIAGLLLACSAGTAGFATEIEVRMLNKGSDGERMVFEPAVIQAEIGDTIRFVPVDKGHNAATIKGAIPESAETARGKINQELVYEVTADGVHVFECTPHASLGMIALIVAGQDFSNLEAVTDARLSKRAQGRFEAYVDEARGLNS